MDVSKTFSSFLFLFLCFQASLGVITNQGMHSYREESENQVEEREFEGWLQSRPEEYIMSLQQHNRNKVTAPKLSTQKVTFFDESKLTYKKGPYNGFPKHVMGMYILLADDTEPGYGTNADWDPKLHKYQQEGANVLFFTFINPETMEVPRSFKRLAATRGKDVEGAVPKDTLIIFAIGGYQYSLDYNPWHWLKSRPAAEAMAVKVAKWRDLYGIDGIDLDIEEGAGSKKQAGPNMLYFVKKLKSIHPDLMVSQPTYGYPQVQAEIDVINGGWRKGGDPTGLVDSIGLMVYEGTQALNYVKNYASGTSQWDGFPIKVDVPKSRILLGCKGSSNRESITGLASAAVKQEIMGVMVWYCSVRDGLKYSEAWDCSGRPDSEQAYVDSMSLFHAANNY